MAHIITPTQAKILEQVARYKFLTVSQMITLGVATQRSNLYTAIAPLRDTRRPLIKEIKFGTDPRKGKLESFYHLTNRGKNDLLDNGLLDEEEIKLPKGTSSLFTSDYEHRKLTLNCHIACALECQKKGVDLIQFDRYFDKTGNNRTGKNLKAKTSINYLNGYIIADGSFLISKGKTSRLYALELYNDRNTKRIISQLKKHMNGIKESALCHHFGIEKGHRVCSIFSNKGIMDAVMERFDGENLTDYFFFKMYNQVAESFLKNWESKSTGKTSLIP